MRAITIMALLITLAGCASIHGMSGMPGAISEEVSEFDGVRHVVMDPAILVGWDSARIGLSWRSTMQPDEVVLTAMIQGAHNIETVAFNIDGDIVRFDPLDAMTRIWTESGAGAIGPTNWSQRDFAFTRQLVERMLAAKRVIIRVNTTHGFVDAKFESEAPMMARPAFRAFHTKIWGQQS